MAKLCKEDQLNAAPLGPLGTLLLWLISKEFKRGVEKFVALS